MATLTPVGAVPTSPTVLLADLIADAVALSPGLTTALPGSMIEDMSSTATGALVVQDGQIVDLLNSISPYTANSYILTQLGNVYGVQQGIGSNTSVYVVFTGTPGYTIDIGFIVSDGTYQYTVQDGGAIASGGESPALYCLATVSGSWAIPEGSVVQLITSVPSGYTLTCTNPTVGLPGAAAQTVTDYQAQVISAGLATCQGTANFIKTQLQLVSGVQARLISVQTAGSGLKVIVGGGDPYQVGAAIYNAIGNINILQVKSSLGTTEIVDILDYPDTYPITFVIPTQQTITVAITYKVLASANIVSNAVITSLAAPAIVNYINLIYVGQAVNSLSISDAFTSSVASVLPESSISELAFVITIDSSVISPTGTLYQGDVEGYFNMIQSDITITLA
jgi:hypothetical protein